MKTANLVLAVVISSFTVSAPVYAGGSAEHFSESLGHSVQAIGHSTVAGFKLVSGSVAIPLVIVGEIGKASGEAGEALWEEANTSLPLTEKVLTVGPSPADAMASEGDN